MQTHAASINRTDAGTSPNFYSLRALISRHSRKLATLRQCLFFIQRKDLYSGTSTNSPRRPRTRYSQPHLHSTTFTVKKLPCTKGFILLILINHSAGREGFELFTCSRTPRGPAVADHEENDGDLSIEKSY